MLNIDKLKRTGAVALPSAFTIGNMAFGFFAIMRAIEKDFSTAGWFIIGAMVMDSLDGRVARMVKGESSFGIEIDSLADFLSFGIAPAITMYLFHLKDYEWGGPVAFIYALCGCLRLARFNVMSHNKQASKQSFTGLPIPGAAGILASFLIVYSLLETAPTGRSMQPLMNQMPFIYNTIPFLMLGLGFLMVSTVPYAAFKQGNLLRPKTLGGMMFIVVLGFFVIRYPRDTIFLIFALYVLSGILAWVFKAIKMLAFRKQQPPPQQPDKPEENQVKQA